MTSGYPGISLCMIVRDESFYIEEMLSSVRPHVDEIIVVDTGSVDNTVDLCRPFVDHLLHFDWIEDFAAAAQMFAIVCGAGASRTEEAQARLSVERRR